MGHVSCGSISMAQENRSPFDLPVCIICLLSTGILACAGLKTYVYRGLKHGDNYLSPGKSFAPSMCNSEVLRALEVFFER